MVKPHSEPANVSRSDDEVLIDGPDGMTASLTPEAALKTAERLEASATEALEARGNVGPDRSAPAARPD